ncbi:MAG: hypothetical protein WCT20_01350 [Candidatus Babeliales bacterium]
MTLFNWLRNVTLSFLLLCGVQAYANVAKPEGLVIDTNNAPGTLFHTIADENLKTLGQMENDGGISALDAEIRSNGVIGLFKSAFKKKCNPSPSARRMRMFTLLKKYEEDHTVTSTNVLDKVTWQDLELLSGPKSAPEHYVASVLDRTITEAGRIMLFKKLVNPSADINQLRDQQAVVQELINNTQLFTTVDQKLQKLVTPENVLLSFWDDNDLYTLQLDGFQFQPDFELDKKSVHIKALKQWLDKNSIAMEANHRYEQFREKFSAIAMIISIGYLLHEIGSGVGHVKNDKDGNPTNDIAEVKWTGATNLPMIGAYLCSKKGLALATSCFILYEMSKHAYREFWKQPGIDTLIREKLHATMAYVAQYINSLRELADILEKNPVLANKVPAVAHFKETLKKLNESDSDLKNLFALLNTSTLKGKYSDLTNLAGRVIVAYGLMMEHKERFVEAMLAVGEIDAQLSIAKLYKEFQGQRVTFCFPQFIEGGNQPMAIADDFWNPCLDKDKAVSSSLHVGPCSLVGKQSHAPNVIITGPNAGGKSTVTKAFVLNIILAQSLGIAPSRSLAFTPFTNIRTYLNITDDIAAGNSHFKAGVLRAQDILKTVSNLQPGTFGLMAVDEVFNGTTHAEGQAAAFGLIEEFGKNPRAMCITNTHFNIIPKLALTKRFENYKVIVHELADGKLEYPFTLEPGVSDQVITLKILRNEGFGDGFLKRAQEVLDNWNGVENSLGAAAD